jgi:hypothetical protein
MNRNVPILGFFIGLLLPFIGDVIVYFILFHSQMSFNEYLQIFKYSHTDAAKAMSLGLLINLAPFIYYTNKRLDHTARGILSATILYFVIIVLLKYVW